MINGSTQVIHTPINEIKMEEIESQKWSHVNQLADSALSKAFVPTQIEKKEVDQQEIEKRIDQHVSSFFRRTISTIQTHPLKTLAVIGATATLGYSLALSAAVTSVVAGAALLTMALGLATLKVIGLVHQARVKAICRTIDRLELAGLVTVQMSHNLRNTMGDLIHDPALYHDLVHMQIKKWKTGKQFSESECEYLKRLLDKKGVYQMFKEVKTLSFDDKGNTKVERHAKSIPEEIKTSVLQLHTSSKIHQLLKALEKNDQSEFKKALIQHYKELTETNKSNQDMVAYYTYKGLAQKIERVANHETFATFVRLQRYQNLFNRHDQFLTQMTKGLNEIYELGLDKVDPKQVEVIQEKLEQLHQVSAQLLEDYTTVNSNLDDVFASNRGHFTHKYRIIDEFINRMNKEVKHTFGDLPRMPGLKGKVSKKESTGITVDPKVDLEKRRKNLQAKLSQPNLTAVEIARLESHIKSLDRSILDLAKVEKIKQENNLAQPLSPLDKKTIMITTCSFGTGHKQTAQALKSHIGNSAHVTIMDPTDYDTGIWVQETDFLYRFGKLIGKKWSSVNSFNWILQNQKYWMIRLENAVDGVICKIFNKTKSGIAKAAVGVETNQKTLLRYEFEMEQNDALFSSYHMDTNSYREVAKELGIPFIHVPTDYDVKMKEVFGNKPPEDPYFKIFLPDANERTLETAQHLGLDQCHYLTTEEGKIEVAGIALRPEFYIKRTEDEIKAIKKEKGIDPEATVVLVLSGGNGQELPYPEMLLNSATNGKKYHMIVVAGGNKTAGNNLNAKKGKDNRFITGKNPNVTIEVAEDPAIASDKQPYFIGASELSRLQAIADVAITKPGGLSIAELLQTGVPMIPDRRVTPMVWEDFNIDVIQSDKRGKAYTGKEPFLDLLDEVAVLGKRPKENHSKWFTHEMVNMMNQVESDEDMVNAIAYRQIGV